MKSSHAKTHRSKTEGLFLVKDLALNCVPLSNGQLYSILHPRTHRHVLRLRQL